MREGALSHFRGTYGPSVRSMARVVLTWLAVMVLTACGSVSADQDVAGGPTIAPPARFAPTEVGRGFARPVAALSPAPLDPRIFVAEQHTGQIHVITNGTRADAAVLDLGDRISTGEEQGLLGMAFAPDFPQTGNVFVNYTDTDGTTHVARFTLIGDQAALASEVEYLTVEQPWPNHNGGHLAFGPDGMLWVGLGDGGGAGDPENRAQSPEYLHGKMLRLDPADPSVPPDVWGLGLRNPWRYSFDGDALWIGDVGQSGVEEIDRVPSTRPAGVNFGWPIFEGDRRYRDDNAVEPERYAEPVSQYDHADGCSVTGGLVVRDPGLPALDGQYIYADYCSGHIWAIAADVEPGTPARELSDAFGGMIPNIVSFGTDGDGRILVTVHDGRILRLTANG